LAVEAAGRLGAGIRGEFPILAHTTYLNSCSQGALSHRVRAAYEEYLDGWDAHGAEWAVWVERADAARAAFARLLKADPAELAVTTSVTQGVSGIVSALDLRTRPKIVISEYEFPTVGQIAHAQELRGAEVVHVRPEPDGSIAPERFAEAVDERTALVCCTTVSYRTGHRHDVAEIARLAHDAGAYCLADSYQAIGAVDFDARALGVDFVTGGTVKYLLGSSGLGFLYVRRELHEQLLPSQTGWFADEDIFQMDISDYSPAADARRFDAGTPPVPNIYAGLAGMAIVEDAGTAGIEEHVAGLAERLHDGATELGLQVVTPRGARSPLVAIKSTDVTALVRELAAENIAASERDSNLRVSLHLYNVEEDVDRLLEALREKRSLLA
jgi:selenocysteine lyase/cysteine desulfurase